MQCYCCKRNPNNKQISGRDTVAPIQQILCWWHMHAPFLCIFIIFVKAMRISPAALLANGRIKYVSAQILYSMYNAIHTIVVFHQK